MTVKMDEKISGRLTRKTEVERGVRWISDNQCVIGPTKNSERDWTGPVDGETGDAEWKS